MSDRKALARAIATCTAPRFIEIKEEKRDRRAIVLVLFAPVFPSLWILAAVFDRMLPDNSGHHSPREERERQAEGDAL